MFVPEAAFFEVSAELIPLLYLTVALEFRFGEPPPREAMSTFGPRPTSVLISSAAKWLAFCVSAVGLVACLVVLAEGAVTPTQTVMVVTAYVALGLALGARLFVWGSMVYHSPGASAPVLLVMTPALLGAMYGMVAWALNHS